MKVSVKKKQARFKKIRGTGKPGMGVGEFFLLVDISAEKDTVCIPVSIASGKKPAGFVYQIEGSGAGAISTTHLSFTGPSVAQVTLGTLTYAKIPKGTTATFRILIEIKGRVGKEYRIVINRINYKHTPSDARYQKFTEEISSAALKFD